MKKQKGILLIILGSLFFVVFIFGGRFLLSEKIDSLSEIQLSTYTIKIEKIESNIFSNQYLIKNVQVFDSLGQTNIFIPAITIHNISLLPLLLKKEVAINQVLIDSSEFITTKSDQKLLKCSKPNKLASM